MLTPEFHSQDAAIYRFNTGGNVRVFVASTPETRRICNDPQVAGIEYTDLLRNACASILKTSDFRFDEDSSVVVNILRGGLNYGLRNALHDAYGWNRHTTCFISAQRARNSADSEEWHITENSYRKLYFPRTTTLFIGDVVATGTSLRYALNELIASAQASGTEIRDIVFFTIGGPAAIEILEDLDAECRRHFPAFRQSILIFLEGCFNVPAPDTNLSVRLTGTDLVRLESVMAPEFIESQYEDAAYPVERCVIYDAGSRAFYVREYAEDVTHYWKQVLGFADRGVTFAEYLAERFPELDASRFGEVELRSLALRQIERMKALLP
jgi:pyrimidine operon attenuation protein/uracil phosphoribosyltransferase